MAKVKKQRVVGCPGCGLKWNNQPITLASGYNASIECYQKFSELRSYSIGKKDKNFIHQHAIDTYAAQHSGNGMKSITTAFSLIGLYYAIEKGYNGRQVQRVHTLLGRKEYAWPVLEPPDLTVFSLTVNDVLKEEPGISRDQMLRRWMYDVWEGWEHQHNWAREICNTLLN